MQTFLPLSLEEKQIIKKRYRARDAHANQLMLIGGLLTFVALFLYLIELGVSGYRKDNIWMVILLPAAIVGLLLAAFIIKRKNYRLSKAAMLIDTKQCIKGYFKGVTPIADDKLRYHFSSFSLDVFLGINSSRELTIINPIHTLRDLELSIHIVNLPSFGNLLLKVFCNDQPFTGEETLPLTRADKSHIMPYALLAYRVIACLLLFIAGLVSFLASWNKQVLPFSIGIPVSIMLCAFIYRTILVLMSKNKMVLTTRITEKVNVWVTHGKRSSQECLYRLENGLLENYGRSDFQIGNYVRLSFLRKRNGTRGELFEVEKLTSKENL
jgi:hypothetical protein